MRYAVKAPLFSRTEVMAFVRGVVALETAKHGRGAFTGFTLVLRSTKPGVEPVPGASFVSLSGKQAAIVMHHPCVALQLAVAVRYATYWMRGNRDEFNWTKHSVELRTAFPSSDLRLLTEQKTPVRRERGRPASVPADPGARKLLQTRKLLAAWEAREARAQTVLVRAANAKSKLRKREASLVRALSAKV